MTTKLYLDAGHGGADSGAVGNALYEKDVVLKITQKLASYLRENYNGVELLLTRDSDTFLSLADRTYHANNWGADAFVSIHINSNKDPKPRGFETYIYTNVDAETIAFQNVMHQEIVKQIQNVPGVIDRGKKRANFHVLRESKMKAILTENFFISNGADAILLKSDEFLNKVAEGHAIGIEKFFGLERKIRPPTNETLFQVIAGTFSNRENAERLAKDLIQNGYNAYINAKE